MTIRRSMALACLLAVCALGASGCTRSAPPSGSGTASPGPNPWTHHGMLRIATSLTPNTLNPILSTQQVEALAEAFVLEPLIATGPDGADVPILAATVPTLENGGIGRDGRTITYRLRHGVRWHDGASFSSHDVAFTFRAIMNPATNVATRHGWDAIARVDTPDPYTVVFHLKRPFAPAVHTFFAHSDAPYFVLPEHLLGRERNLNRVAFNDHPIGTGPYRFVRWVRGDHMDYVANDGYYLGRPEIREIMLQFVPDENTIVSELRAHEIDWFALATPRVYPQLAQIAGIDPRLVPLNANDSIIFNTTHPPLDNPSVRRAIGLAVDKPELVRKATFGTTVAATEDLPPFLWASDPHVGTSMRDLPRAKQLLDAAGWRVGPDGTRAKAGRKFVMGLAYRSDSATDRQRSVLIASMLHDAGIEVELKGYTTALLYAGPGVGVLADGKFDAGLQTWYSGVDPDDSTQLTCDQIPPHGYNWSRYCNAMMDAAQRDALGHYDRPTRKRAYATIETLLARDAPFVYLWWPRQIEAVNSDLKGFRPNGIIENWNSWEWSI